MIALLGWLLICFGIYILIGLCVLTYVVHTDKYGGYILSVPAAIVVIILGYPFLIIRSIFK